MMYFIIYFFVAFLGLHNVSSTPLDDYGKD